VALASRIFWKRIRRNTPARLGRPNWFAVVVIEVLVNLL